jgi:hypothetical protein
VAKLIRDRHSMIAHKSGNRPSQELKMGKPVAPLFALESDCRKPAAGIRGELSLDTSNSVHTTCLIDIV